MQHNSLIVKTTSHQLEYFTAIIDIKRSPTSIEVPSKVLYLQPFEFTIVNNPDILTLQILNKLMVCIANYS